MNSSRTANTIRNVKVALTGQLLGLIISFVSRRIFVQFLSAEYLGLNGLFSNILSMLSLAELGVGTAIIFSLYKPIAENNISEIKSLMQLYKQAYIIIGVVVLVAGCLLTPYLCFFIDKMPDIPDIQLIYIMYVVNSSVSYFFTYKRELIIAYQQRYITTIYRYGLYIVLNIAQIIALILTHSFILYLLLQTVNTLIENVLVSWKANHMFPFLKERDVLPLSLDTKKQIKKNVYAMMAHKVGSVVVNGTDNVLISKMVGVLEVGLYSNYTLIRQALVTVIGGLFLSVSASFGNLNAVSDDTKKLQVFHAINFVGAWIYGFCSICLLILYNPFIKLWLGEKYLFSLDIVIWIVIVFYVTGMRQASLTVRDVMGIFWFDRYKPLFEAIVNLVVSIVLGNRLGVAGILIGTFVSTMTTCFWIEPLMLYKHGLHAPVHLYFLRYGVYTLVTVLAGGVTFAISSLITAQGIIALLAKILICIIIPNIIFLLCYSRTEEFHYVYNIVKAKKLNIK